MLTLVLSGCGNASVSFGTYQNENNAEEQVIITENTIKFVNVSFDEFNEELRQDKDILSEKRICALETVRDLNEVGNKKRRRRRLFLLPTRQDSNLRPRESESRALSSWATGRDDRINVSHDP